MNWFYFLCLLGTFFSNAQINELFSKVDYQVFLGLYLQNESNLYDFIAIIFDIFIYYITGVNIYDLQSCLRIFGII